MQSPQIHGKERKEKLHWIFLVREQFLYCNIFCLNYRNKPNSAWSILVSKIFQVPNLRTKDDAFNLFVKMPDWMFTPMFQILLILAIGNYLEFLFSASYIQVRRRLGCRNVELSMEEIRWVSQHQVGKDFLVGHDWTLQASQILHSLGHHLHLCFLHRGCCCCHHRATLQGNLLSCHCLFNVGCLFCSIEIYYLYINVRLVMHW